MIACVFTKTHSEGRRPWQARCQSGWWLSQFRAFTMSKGRFPGTYAAPRPSERRLFLHPNGPWDGTERTPPKSRRGGHFNRLLSDLDIKGAKITQPNGMPRLGISCAAVLVRGWGAGLRGSQRFCKFCACVCVRFIGRWSVKLNLTVNQESKTKTRQKSVHSNVCFGLCKISTVAILCVFSRFCRKHSFYSFTG